MPNERHQISSKKQSASRKWPPVRLSDNNYKVPVQGKQVKTKSVVNWKEKEYFVYGFDENNAFGLKLSSSHSARPLDSLLTNEAKRLSTDDFISNDGSHLSVLDVKLDLPKLNDSKLTDSQITTGNIGIDFTNPVYQGSFNVVKYSSDSVAKVKDLIDSMAFLNGDHQFLVVALSRHDSIAKSGRQNLVELFPASDSKEDTLKTIHLLYATLNYYKSHSKNVVLIIDDAVSLFYKLFNFYHFNRSEVN